jgi:hypothetical protein
MRRLIDSNHAGRIFVLIGLLAGSFFALRGSTRAWLPHFATPLYGAATGSQDRSERLEVEVITLRPTGFEPTEIKRPPGRFILVVNNQSGISEVEVRLDAETGALAEGHLPKGKKRWRTVIAPRPGRYVLTALGPPERTAHIIITSQ